MTNEEKLREIFPKTIFIYRKEDDKTSAIQCSDEWLNAEYQEPTTKNDLGVDCISRADARSLICEVDLKHHTFGMSRKAFKDLYNGMDELPSVTPQEPRWIPVSERLPDTDDEVLCWYEYYHWSQEKVLPEYGIGCYFKETSAWYGEVAVGRDVRVIAWMPLQPYREVENDKRTDIHR